MKHMLKRYPIHAFYAIPVVGCMPWCEEVKNYNSECHSILCLTRHVSLLAGTYRLGVWHFMGDR